MTIAIYNRYGIQIRECGESHADICSTLSYMVEGMRPSTYIDVHFVGHSSGRNGCVIGIPVSSIHLAMEGR